MSKAKVDPVRAIVGKTIKKAEVHVYEDEHGVVVDIHFTDGTQWGVSVGVTMDATVQFYRDQEDEKPAERVVRPR